MNNDNIDRIKENNNKAIPSFLVTGATGNIGSELIEAWSLFDTTHLSPEFHFISQYQAYILLILDLFS
jgi:hypothetical protein